MILLIDNFDSFTYNLVDYFQQLGASCEVHRNDEELTEIKKKYKAVVLSPGPERPEKAGILLPTLRHYVGQLPILGICLGHQAIGMHFGAQLVKAKRPMHGKISKIHCSESILFKSFPEHIQVVRYHSLILDNLPPELTCTASTPSGEIMALQHRQLPICGVQFHPEAFLTENGLKILENWIAHYRLVD